MKNFRVTVNGNTYDVAVEELSEGTAPQPIQQATPAPKATPAPSVTKQQPKTTAPASAKKINSPMPGTVLDIKVKEGDTVSKNQLVIVLEAMKMENEIVTPYAGKVASINVSKGAAVNSGDLLLSIIE